MKNLKIVIAGGSGFVGQAIAKHYASDNKIIILTTQSQTNNHQKHAKLFEHPNVCYIFWDGKNVGDWVKEMEASDLLINLAGKSVNCRYTKKNKEAILLSRVNTTKALGAAIDSLKQPPKCWINASSATIYKHSETVENNEYNTDFENDFSVQVCKAWENAFDSCITPNTNKITLRMAIVLGNGGVMVPFKNLCKFGLGGKQGKGNQMFSWLHIEDLLRMVEYLFNNNKQGIYNAAAPNPVTNIDLMKSCRYAMGIAFGIPAYSLILKIGAWIISTEVELIFKSRYVVSKKLADEGFVFKHPLIDAAIKDLV